MLTHIAKGQGKVFCEHIFLSNLNRRLQLSLPNPNHSLNFGFSQVLMTIAIGCFLTIPCPNRRLRGVQIDKIFFDKPRLPCS